MLTAQSSQPKAQSANCQLKTIRPKPQLKAQSSKLKAQSSKLKAQSTNCQLKPYAQNPSSTPNAHSPMLTAQCSQPNAHSPKRQLPTKPYAPNPSSTPTAQSPMLTAHSPKLKAQSPPLTPHTPPPAGMSTPGCGRRRHRRRGGRSARTCARGPTARGMPLLRARRHDPTRPRRPSTPCVAHF